MSERVIVTQYEEESDSWAGGTTRAGEGAAIFGGYGSAAEARAAAEDYGRQADAARAAGYPWPDEDEDDA